MCLALDDKIHLRYLHRWVSGDSDGTDIHSSDAAGTLIPVYASATTEYDGQRDSASIERDPGVHCRSRRKLFYRAAIFLPTCRPGCNRYLR